MFQQNTLPLSWYFIEKVFAQWKLMSLIYILPTYYDHEQKVSRIKVFNDETSIIYKNNVLAE